MHNTFNVISRMSERLNGVTWRMQILLFCTVFWVSTFICSLPRGEGIGGFTLNQMLEDFGVFLLFLSIWTGIFAHFRKSISLPWLCLLLGVALWQEEVNLFNKTYQAINLWFGHEIDSSERQRGDVFILAIVCFSLLARFLKPGFKSFFRIHITGFVLLYTLFQLWVHYIFPYQMQKAILAPQLAYQMEFTSTYEGRFQYQCDHGKWTCFSWTGDEIPTELSSNSQLMDLIKNHEGVFMDTDGFVGFVPTRDQSVFRGVDAAQKYIVTYFKNQSLQRVVMDHEFAQKAAQTVTRPMLIFSTSFGMVWFFGGLFIVFMHQARRHTPQNR